MQFYLDGHQDRDPYLQSPAPDVADIGQGPLPEQVDVLIVGAGPAGMLLATQLSQFPSIVTRVVERRGHALEMGHADGIHPRSMEMFDAFGVAHLIMREGYQANDFTFWSPDEGTTTITRQARTPDMPAGTSEFPHIVINQARVQDFLAERMRKSSRRLVPDYGHTVLSVKRDDHPEYPVLVTLQRDDADGSTSELSVRAKYVIGCDGARSVVRQSMGLELEGDFQNHAWGVVDAVVDTDFPDLRFKCSVTSATGGHVLAIPREGGYLVRLYVDMGTVAAGDREFRARVTLDEIVAEAQAVLAPYRLEPKHVQWWSLYEVGQRHTSRFDDCAPDERANRTPRIFIAGDACHTHSAKAGQGMNVSMADAYNLGWKLAAVLEGRSPETLLHSYNAERHPIAVELIEFDRFWAQLASGIDDQGKTITVAERQQHQARRRRFMAGVATLYPHSTIMGRGAHQHLATGFPVGERFHSAPVVRIGDAKPMQLGHVHEADGRWRMYVFADTSDVRDPISAMGALCTWLDSDPASPLRRFTPAGANIDSVIDVRGIFPHANDTIDLPDLPTLLFPKKGSLEVPDWEKAFAADQRPGHDIYTERGIDREQGCIVVVRPDQFVADIFPLSARNELTEFFAGSLHLTTSEMEHPA